VSERHRANYTTVYLGALLGPDGHRLELDWADDVGDATADHEFSVPTADATDALVGVQAFDVGDYGHEIRVNGEALSGFDIPPNDGWQHWVDTVTNVDLREGDNTVALHRDPDSVDAFAVVDSFHSAVASSLTSSNSAAVLNGVMSSGERSSSESSLPVGYSSGPRELGSSVIIASYGIRAQIRCWHRYIHSRNPSC